MGLGRQLLVRLPRWAALWAVVMFSGCFSTPKHVDRSIGFVEAPVNPAEVYTLGHPDVVEVLFASQPNQGQTVRVEADGCLHLRNVNPVHVEGENCSDAAAEIAESAGLRPEDVHVQVVEYSSRQLFLFGQVNGGPRVVEYHGPETVVDVLARTGGLLPSAASNEIYIVRAQMTEGMPAEVLNVDLEAIRRHDDRTNFRVQPLDEIYVGEMPRARIGRVIPTLLKPLYQGIVQLLPCRASHPAADDSDPAK